MYHARFSPSAAGWSSKILLTDLSRPVAAFVSAIPGQLILGSKGNLGRPRGYQDCGQCHLPAGKSFNKANETPSIGLKTVTT
ncbi:hypothetical protein GRJ2_001083800 [Grus japonensis]|uniref:Uncharacterized protein n=1 Tax=Grus japonensis TaxID=30415 RepID=A0ABC9WLM2_GRUJA